MNGHRARLIDDLPIEERVPQVLKTVSVRRADGLGWDHVECIDGNDHLLSREVQAIARRIQDGETVTEEELDVVLEAIDVAGVFHDSSDCMEGGVGSGNAFLEYVFAEGPHPGNVVKRVYALAQTFRADLIWEMSREEIATMLGHTRAAESKRLQMLESHGRGLRSKGSAHRAAATESARNNKNRKKSSPPKCEFKAAI